MRQDQQARRVSNCAVPLISSSHPICLPLLKLHATYLLELLLFFHILNCGTIRSVQFRFKNQSEYYDPDGISGFSKEKYLEFLENFFALAHLNAKKDTRMAFINADWPPARRPTPRRERFSEHPGPEWNDGQFDNDRWLSPYYEEKRVAAYAYYASATLLGAFQCGCRIGHAKEKDTGRNLPVHHHFRENIGLYANQKTPHHKKIRNWALNIRRPPSATCPLITDLRPSRSVIFACRNVVDIPLAGPPFSFWKTANLWSP